MVGDAKALQHIFHASGYRYPKTADANHMFHQITGNGVATVGGWVYFFFL